jgi:hypothetical protein
MIRTRLTVSVVSRVAEVVFARRFDRELVAGVAPEPGSALALHIARLTSTREREELARALERRARDAHTARVVPSAGVPVNRAGIVAAETHIDEVVTRLRAPRPVSAHGVARLRLLLADGTGPFYQGGRGNLIAELGEVLATL